MTAPSTTITPGTDQPIATTSPIEWHDEASVAVNPTDPSNVIAASSKYTLTPSTRSLSVSFSRDGGRSWAPSTLPPLPGTAGGGGGLTTPVLAFGADGAAHLLVIATDARVLRSDDGGATWKAASDASVPAATSLTWFACDSKRPSRLFIAAGSVLRGLGEAPDKQGAALLRSNDSGRSWTQTALRYGSRGALSSAYAPHVAVDSHGTIHVTSHVMSDVGTFVLVHWRSDDGGETFTAQPITGPLNLTPLSAGNLHVSACVVNERRLVVAWAAVHDGVSRIFYRATDDGGVNWQGPVGGTPLPSRLGRWPGLAATGPVSRFRPQLSATGNGVVGCAFYELTEWPGMQQMRLMLAPSLTSGDDFEPPLAVSDTSWDPTTGAAAGRSIDQQCGSYFGLASDASSLLVLWPDTRTGAQTLYFDRARVEWTGPRPSVPSDHIAVDVRLEADGGGWVVVVKRGGKVIYAGHLPGTTVPGGPGPRPGAVDDLVQALRVPPALDDFEADPLRYDARPLHALGHTLRQVAAALLEGATLPDSSGADERR